MSKLQLENRTSIPQHQALTILSDFIKRGAKGLSIYTTQIGNVCVTKRDYRKNDCYVIYEDVNKGGQSDE